MGTKGADRGVKRRGLSKDVCREGLIALLAGSARMLSEDQIIGPYSVLYSHVVLRVHGSACHNRIQPIMRKLRDCLFAMGS